MIFSLIFWLLFGWLADYSFPFGQAIDLIVACFKGTIAAKVNLMQHKLLQKTDIISQPDNQKQIYKLNILESQLWLCQEILEILGADASTNHEKIAKTIQALENKRNKILEELEPRRSPRYRVFANIQDYVRPLFSSQADKDYKQIQKIVTNLLNFINQQPSPISFAQVITKLSAEVAAINQISAGRLRLAYQVHELLKILSAKLSLYDDASSYDINDAEALRNEIIRLRDELDKYQKIVNNPDSYISYVRDNLGIQYIRKNPSKKYHYNVECPHWKQLAWEYMIAKLSSTSDNLSVFSVSSNPPADISDQEKCQKCGDELADFDT
ncbi:MAG TPA: hypothetical protein IGS52_24370 [Oscillatoriaceae cyanobacterium M33_DOE_052]|uniref:Uncharacterized protein n=1 Tax=Planktothricoides sp. SpSt-374 TaxID=2282167 RepID=A0A7C3ZRH8_9CYAN|nr:hypothetical protein [Oscillatoriaceae cyanobacterium M33_DOE_052]